VTYDLTRRERDVLECAAHGLNNAEAGRRLFVSAETVKGYKRDLFRKLQQFAREPVRNTAHAVAIAFRLGLLEIPRVGRRIELPELGTCDVAGTLVDGRLVLVLEPRGDA
jgi:DNA-binding CsgD family transcriptional regulator